MSLFPDFQVNDAKKFQTKKPNFVFIYVETAASVFSNGIKPVNETRMGGSRFFYSPDALRWLFFNMKTQFPGKFSALKAALNALQWWLKHLIWTSILW